ncbi:tripartite tricarboxylate transporter substrate binding protein [Nocardioides maradonensis]
MKTLKKLTAAAVTVTALAGLSACNGAGGGSGADAAVRIMVPNSPGGGYDTTARTAAKIVEDEGINKDIEVYNLEGAGGTTGLAKLVSQKGKDGELMLMGLGVVGATYTNQSEKTLADTTPIARLISEPDILVVPATSPLTSLDDAVKAWKSDTAHFPVGGGSSPGGPDHLAAHLVADAVGITPKDVNYVEYDGGGPLLAALLSGEVKVGVTGVGEVKSQIDAGQLRVLGVTSAQRIAGFDEPTLKEQGVDLDFTNWRGLVAPPGISAEERDRLVAMVEKLHGTQAWKDAEAKNGWTDAFLTGDAFGEFIGTEDGRVADILGELGLA